MQQNYRPSILKDSIEKIQMLRDSAESKRLSTPCNRKTFDHTIEETSNKKPSKVIMII